MAKFEWSKDATRNLISVLQALPELWDVSNDSYKNRVKRSEAIEYLAGKFGTNTGEISRKLHNLRTQYNNELRKARKRKSGQSNDDMYSSKWEFFDQLKFMQSSLKLKESLSNLPIMSKRKCTANEKLLQDFPSFTKGKTLHHVFCKICDTHISIGNKGRLDIMGHISTVKHKKNLQSTASTSDVLLKFIAPNEDIKYEFKETTHNELAGQEIIEKAEREAKLKKTRQEREEISEKAVELNSDSRNHYDEAKIFGDFVASVLRGFHSRKCRRQLERRIQSAILEFQEIDDADVSEAVSTL